MYFTKTEPIKGKAKTRYYDFIVQEIYEENNKTHVAKIIDFDKEENKQENLYEIPENTENKDYLYFDLQKVNTDLNNVIKALALRLRIGKSKISFAGIKDKRGVTSQRICIYRPDIDLLRKFGWNMIRMFNFRWADDKITIGDLKENKFTLIIRNIDPEKNLQEIVENFKIQIKNGIPNKFGEQRFGGIRNITHRVGKLIILEKTKEGVMLYLEEIAEKEHEEVKKARQLIKENKFVEALKAFPKKGYRYEKAILHHLHKYPNDYVNAWLQLPKNITYLFSHAYQSYIFNKYIDLRMQKLKKPLEKHKGDVVDEENYVLGPLFGYEFEFAKDKIKTLEETVLNDENITLKEFKVKNFPQMSVAGARRRIKLDVKDFKLLEIGNDEFNENKQFVKIGFTLPKGSYATTVLEELMKPYS